MCLYVFNILLLDIFILFKSRLPTVLLYDDKGRKEGVLFFCRDAQRCFVSEVLIGLQGEAFSEDLTTGNPRKKPGWPEGWDLPTCILCRAHENIVKPTHFQGLYTAASTRVRNEF